MNLILPFTLIFILFISAHLGVTELGHHVNRHEIAPKRARGIPSQRLIPWPF